MKSGMSNVKMPQPDNQDTGVTALQIDHYVSGVLMSRNEPLDQNMFFSESQNKNVKVTPYRRKKQ
jgi:hypothetical protein